MIDKTENIKMNLLNDKTTSKVSQFFKAIADPTRIKILFALKNGPLSVNELTSVMVMTQSAVSHQLRVLKDSNLVINKKIGKEVYYRLADDHVHVIFNQAIEHVGEWVI
ncbi:Transcriptional regulator, ArsR [Alteracholeplasma palmae J233]|uniref:Transcriptional regulator, ArsR n=1 Tax=Alteracholeplasma palmae (strain ATCC 49389 / J233) TaxID=1318466 RepID=U4KQH6_ALTPJ|nr:metalloregulator ArsR/SmtB family transcription factor [Alteracholeplasma palmae]CCV64595.1 Transcriptional regulator, ArsR [Alteracholeplasma palmae J233]